jgi:UDP-N-acetylmuramoyl-tripeptide--D-alanyl-D-alanine ligase
MLKFYFTRYLAVYPSALLYMLQDTEYRLGRYTAWYLRTADFRTVMKRRSLELTPKVKLLRVGLWTLWLLVVIVTATCVMIGYGAHSYIFGLVALLLIVLLPYILAFGIVIPLALGWVLIQKPRERAIIDDAKQRFADNKAIRIGIAGSFGKTTMKEILLTVLREGKNVAATPGNMNTVIGISRFSRQLTGKEDVLIIELGEEHPGDVKTLSELSRPTMGVITGINEAHLSSFRTLDRTVATVFELVEHVGDQAIVYKNGESQLVLGAVDKTDPYVYSKKGVAGWKVSKVKISIDGTNFVATRGKVVVTAHTGLLGLHTVGMCVTAIAIAHDLGLSVAQFEHRMQPRFLHGAWVIDDTYNGNSQGVQAGLQLLGELDAKRRVYVTPGLVEQGDKTREVHETIGSQIAAVADVVVLMKNSVTDFIVRGLKKAEFDGKLLIIDHPLEFYTNLDQFVATGDVVLMQNDWTDNYR